MVTGRSRRRSKLRPGRRAALPQDKSVCWFTVCESARAFVTVGGRSTFTCFYSKLKLIHWGGFYLTVRAVRAQKSIKTQAKRCDKKN